MLAAWYPLISNMNNQGLADSNLTVSSTPTFVSGLLGGALQGGGAGSWTATQTASILNNTAMSFCFWVYPDAATGDTGARARFFGNDSPRHYSIFQYPTCNDLHWDWRNNAGSIVLGGVLSGVLPSYKWTHVTFTYQNPTFKIYINGVLKHTASASLDVQSYANATPVILACSGRKLCDYRVYTNCLSAKEVQLISRGLLIHYPLSNNGSGCANLYTGTADFSGSWGNYSNWTTDSETYRGFVVKKRSAAWGGLCQNITATNGDIFTISFYAKVQSGGNVQSIHRSNLGNVTTGLEIVGGNFVSSNVWNTTETWKYCWAAVKIVSSDITYLQWRIENSVADKMMYICGFKMEKGNKATPWIPHINDTAYTSMGYNSTTEYDTSGYLHNGTRVGTFSWSSDTPRYSVSSVFKAANTNYITIPAITVDMKNITFASWGKFDTTSNWMRIFDFGEKASGGGYGIVVSNGASGSGGKGLTLVIVGSGGTSLLNQVVYTITTGVWFHVAVTILDSSVKVYVNGELVKTYTVTALNTATPYNLNYLGKSNWSDPYLDGNISDFRMYATALSADDIKELYNTSASLTNNGRLLSYQFVES